MVSLTSPTRITTLDAVNIMLANIGEAPVTALTATSKPTAKKAQARLAEESLRIQSLAYNSFKTVQLELTPSAVAGPGFGHITLPANIASWHPVNENQRDILTEVNGKLYNSEDASFVFTESVTIEAVLARPFTSLSQPARWFITCAAAISFANTEQPGGAYLRVTEITLQEAKRSFEAYDRRLRKGGLRAHNPYFQRMRGNR